MSTTHNVLSKNLEEKLDLDRSWRQNCEHNNLAFTSFNDRNGRCTPDSTLQAPIFAGP